MARSVAQQAADNQRRRAAGQPTVPIQYDSGPATQPPNPTRPMYDAGGTPLNTAAERAGQPAPTTVGSGSGQPAPTPWTPTDKPGYGEIQWEKYGDKWNQPGASTNYWNGVQGHFANPTTHETNVEGYSNVLGSNRGALENLFDQYNNAGDFTNPGTGEQWFAQNGGQYNTASAGEQALGDLIPKYNQTGAAEDFARQNGGFFTTAGAMENFTRDNTGRLMTPGALAQHAGGIASDINSARNTGTFFGRNIHALEAPSFTEGLAYEYDPEKRTYNEDFLLGGGATQGLDSLYNRLYNKGSQRLANEGAARGGFNTGASLRAAEELNADLGAQQVRDYMQASNAADQSRFARDNYGLNLMQGADQSLLGRLGLGLEGAKASDTMALGRAEAAHGLFNDVSGEELARLGLAGDWANQSQTGALARMLGGAGVANQANSSWLARLAGQGSAASDLANQWLNRINSGSEAASRAQGDQNQRIQTGINAADSAQRSWLDRIKEAAGLSSDANTMMWERIMNGGALAGMADNSDLARLSGGFAAANAAEASKQNRQSNTFENLYRAGSGQAGAYGTAQDTARAEQRQAVMDEINGLIAQGGITSQEIMAKYGARMAALGLIIQGGKVVAGAMTGNPGLAAGGQDATGRGYVPGSDGTLPLGYAG